MGRAQALARAQQLAAEGEVVLLRTPQQDIENLGYDFDDVCDCVEALRLEDVERDMEDQYRSDRLVLEFKEIRYQEDPLYVKVSVPSNAGEKLIVLSFKFSGSPR
jgi:MqsR (Motility quorum-sensing regulator) toxin of toxin-antitoxin system